MIAEQTCGQRTAGLAKMPRGTEDVDSGLLVGMPVVMRDERGRCADGQTAEDCAFPLHAAKGQSEQQIVATPIDMRQASRGEKMTNNRAEGKSSGGAPGTGIGEAGDPAPSLAETHTPAVAFNIVGLAQEGKNHAYETKVSGCLQHKGLNVSGNEAGTVIKAAMAVRRLTPLECERLQGMPDNHTLITYRGKPAADGPRYKAIGNSFAVPVVRWIGERIALVESITASP